jgi:hypothetical protein
MGKQVDAAVQAEKRRFYRIEDSVRIGIRVISREKLERKLKRLDPEPQDSLGVLAGINIIAQEMAPALNRLDSTHPDIALCLRGLDRKVETIARAYLAGDESLAKSPIRTVNLSAGGLALRSGTSLEPGSLLEIRLLLLPEFVGVLTYGSLVNCMPLADADGFELRIDFTYITEADQDAISRHIVQRQSHELRKRREAREREELQISR